MQTIAQQLKITKFPFQINDDEGNEIYWESSDGHWIKRKYDDKGNVIYYRSSSDELKQPTLTQKEIIGDREVLNTTTSPNTQNK